MTEREYMERRYSLMNKMIRAKELHCYRSAAARQRDIDRLDKEFEKQKEGG